MYTGHVQLKNGGVDALVDLMNAEYCLLRLVKNINKGFDNFQFGLAVKLIDNSLLSCEENQNKLQILLGNLIFCKGHRPLKFIGDIFFDRLTINSAKTIGFFKALHDNGVVLVMGNHDLYCPGKMKGDTQFGNFIDLPEGVTWQDLKKMLVIADFDKDKGILRTHNGIYLDDNDDVVTWFGTISQEGITSAEELVQKINEEGMRVLGNGDQVSEELLVRSTNFRPRTGGKLERMEALNKKFGIRKQVHGHDGAYDVQEGASVFGINSNKNPTIDSKSPFALSTLIIGD